MSLENDSSTLSIWHWFFTKNGLPVLVGILALITSVTFNIIQLSPRQSAPLDFEPAGSFKSGELMDAIIKECRYESNSRAIPPLRIVADLAQYGYFSHFEKAREYLDVLRKRSNDGANSVSCIFLNEDRRRDVLKLQFKQFEALIKTIPFQEKVEKYMATDYGRAALKDLGLHAKLLTSEALTFDEFINIVIKVDNLIIDDLRRWGIQVRFYPHLLTIHAWSGKRDEALIAIVDFEGAVDETGFFARRHIAENVQKIFEIMEKGSVP